MTSDTSDTGVVRDLVDGYRVLFTKEPEDTDPGPLELWLFRLSMAPFWWMLVLACRDGVPVVPEIDENQSRLVDFND